MLIGQPLCFKDLQDIDNNLFTGLNWCLLPSSDVEPLYETFSIDQDYFGKNLTIDIVPGGSEMDLTNENKEYYVERKAYFLLYK
jgi:E3 ubiquitin-protein ligase NEDD4